MVEPLDAKQAIALKPVDAFLRNHAPFDHMAEDDVYYLASQLKLSFFATGEAIAGPEQGPADRLFIIKQGRIRGESSNGDEDKKGAWELVGGETFPIGALLARRPVSTVHRAVEDTFVFELAQDAFDTLISRSPEFQDFCTRRLASLLDQALTQAQASYEALGSDGDYRLTVTFLRFLERHYGARGAHAAAIEAVTLLLQRPLSPRGRREALGALARHQTELAMRELDVLAAAGSLTAGPLPARLQAALRTLATIGEEFPAQPAWDELAALADMPATWRACRRSSSRLCA